MANNTFKRDNLKSGYVVETRNGERFLVTRANQGKFEKYIVNRNTAIALRNYSTDLKYGLIGNKAQNDIVKVYGLAKNPLHAFCISEINDRPLLWERPAELLNCKICITESTDPGLTVGKIYEVVNGHFKDNSGRVYPMLRDIYDVEELREYIDRSSFVVVVD